METPCLCPSKGHKHGCRKVTETSVVEFCYLNATLHVEINISSTTGIVQLAKIKAISQFLTHTTAFLGGHLNHATQKA